MSCGVWTLVSDKHSRCLSLAAVCMYTCMYVLSKDRQVQQRRSIAKVVGGGPSTSAEKYPARDSVPV